MQFLKYGLDLDGDGDGNEKEESELGETLWDVKAATMALLNALSNCSDSLEERVMIREEFSRRGLNEAIVVSVQTH